MPVRIEVYHENAADTLAELRTLSAGLTGVIGTPSAPVEEPAPANDNRPEEKPKRTRAKKVEEPAPEPDVQPEPEPEKAEEPQPEAEPEPATDLTEKDVRDKLSIVLNTPKLGADKVREILGQFGAEKISMGGTDGRKGLMPEDYAAAIAAADEALAGVGA